jgi:hypothetical protein
VVDSVGLNKINSIPKTRSVKHKTAKKTESGSEKDSQSSKKKKEEKRIGGNIDEVC